MLDKLIKRYGKVTYDGIAYVLIGDDDITGPTWSPHYTANAIEATGEAAEDGLLDVYRVTRYSLQEWLDGDMEDEEWACDWDRSDDVIPLGKG